MRRGWSRRRGACGAATRIFGRLKTPPVALNHLFEGTPTVGVANIAAKAAVLRSQPAVVTAAKQTADGTRCVWPREGARPPSTMQPGPRRSAGAAAAAAAADYNVVEWSATWLRVPRHFAALLSVRFVGQCRSRSS